MSHEESGPLPNGPLRERVKELECLQGIVSIIETPGLSSEKILQGVVDAIPSGWQYPELCRARINIHNAVFQTPGFVETPWMQRVSLKAHGQSRSDPSRSAIPRSGPPARTTPFSSRRKSSSSSSANRLGRLIEEWEADRAAAGPPSGCPPGRQSARPNGRSSWISSGRPIRCSTSGSCAG